MRKRPAWDVLLAEYLDAWRGRPFAWGSTDCGQLVAGALHVMTGEPLHTILADVRAYSSETGAIRAARSLGFGFMEGRLRSLGLTDVEGGLAFAQRGDVLVANRGGCLDALGIVWPATVWTTHPGSECQPYPMRDALEDAILLRVRP